MAPKTRLSDKQKLFIAEYNKCLNGAEAARKAGYKEANANKVAHKMMHTPKIAKALNMKIDKAVEEIDLSAKWVLSSLVKVANRCMQEEPVMKKVDGQLVETGEYQFDSAGANRSLELLGKHQRLFVERQELTGENGKPVEINVKVEFVRPKA